MEKKEIVARFLKRGMAGRCLCPRVFCSKPKKIGEFIQGFQSTTTRPPIITLDLVRSIMKSRLKEEGPTIKIIKKFFINHENEKISISEYSQKLVNYYETKKQLLMSRVDTTKLLSINKIQKQREFVLICMIKEMDRIEKLGVVEDLTGNVTYS